MTQDAFYTDRATLTIANHTGNWYFKSDGDRYATCSSTPVTGKVRLVGLLTGGATYTFSAYSDSGCSTLLAAASPFTAQPVSLRAFTEIETRGYLIGGGMGSTWYYKADAAPYNESCYLSTAGTLLLDLRPNTPYTFSAYSDSACTPANLLVTAETFTIRQLEPLPQCNGIIAIRHEFESTLGQSRLVADVVISNETDIPVRNVEIELFRLNPASYTSVERKNSLDISKLGGIISFKPEEGAPDMHLRRVPFFIRLPRHYSQHYNC